MENGTPVIIQKNMDSYILFSTGFYCFDALIDIPESRAWAFVMELDKFSAARFRILLHRIETLMTNDIVMDELDAIITMAVFHFISLCYLDEHEEEVIKTKCEEWLYFAFTAQRGVILRYSTELIIMLKQHCMCLPGFAAVVKQLES